MELNQGTLSELIGRELHRFGLVIRFEEMSSSTKTTLADVAQGVLDGLKARGYRIVKEANEGNNPEHPADNQGQRNAGPGLDRQE
jgi:hypothetical protein